MPSAQNTLPRLHRPGYTHIPGLQRLVAIICAGSAVDTHNCRADYAGSQTAVRRNYDQRQLDFPARCVTKFVTEDSAAAN